MMLKQTVHHGAVSKEATQTRQYIESLSNVKTPPRVLFSILPGEPSWLSS